MATKPDVSELVKDLTNNQLDAEAERFGARLEQQPKQLASVVAVLSTETARRSSEPQG